MVEDVFKLIFPDVFIVLSVQVCVLFFSIFKHGAERVITLNRVALSITAISTTEWHLFHRRSCLASPEFQGRTPEPIK